MPLAGSLLFIAIVVAWRIAESMTARSGADEETRRLTPPKERVAEPAHADFMATGGRERREAAARLPLLAPDQLDRVPEYLRVDYCLHRIQTLFVKAKQLESEIWSTNPDLRDAKKMLVAELGDSALTAEQNRRIRAYVKDHPELFEVFRAIERMQFLRTALQVADDPRIARFITDGLANGGLQDDFERSLAPGDAWSGYAAAGSANRITTIAEWKTHLQQRLPLYEAAVVRLPDEAHVPTDIVEAIGIDRDRFARRFFAQYYIDSMLSGPLFEAVRDLKRWRETFLNLFPGRRPPAGFGNFYAQTGSSILF
jgi:hypothetical protein